jgi:hypothetical protein
MAGDLRGIAHCDAQLLQVPIFITRLRVLSLWLAFFLFSFIAACVGYALSDGIYAIMSVLLALLSVVLACSIRPNTYLVCNVLYDAIIAKLVEDPTRWPDMFPVFCARYTQPNIPSHLRAAITYGTRFAVQDFMNAPEFELIGATALLGPDVKVQPKAARLPSACDDW